MQVSKDSEVIVRHRVMEIRAPAGKEASCKRTETLKTKIP